MCPSRKQYHWNAWVVRSQLIKQLFALGATHFALRKVHILQNQIDRLLLQNAFGQSRMLRNKHLITLQLKQGHQGGAHRFVIVDDQYFFITYKVLVAVAGEILVAILAGYHVASVTQSSSNTSVSSGSLTGTAGMLITLAKLIFKP